MLTPARAGVLLLTSALVACGPATVPFECSSDEQCTGDEATGRCERTGYCSFIDSSCDTGWRYGGLASSELSDQCVLQCVLSLSLGAEHSCAVLSDGRVSCWGNGLAGRLGNGVVDVAGTPSPVAVDASVPTMGAVSAGGRHTCALTEDDGSVWCWGANDRLQLGAPDVGPLPVRVSALDGAGAPITHIATGGLHTCARASVGTGCWGDNSRGQLGNGTVSPAEPPNLVMMNAGFQEVAAGNRHSCGRTIAGTVHCWGDNSQLQVGASDPNPPYPEPQMVPTPARAASIALGLVHGCMVSSNEKAECWGNNLLAGQLGRPQTVMSSRTPLPVDVPAPVIQIAVGSTHSCALDVEGRAWCWGGNDFGQHGPGRPSTSTFEPQPVVVELPGGIAEIAVGGLHTCARTLRDEIFCWGANEYGQLGNGEINPDGQSEPDATVTASLSCQPSQ